MNLTTVIIYAISIGFFYQLGKFIFELIREPLVDAILFTREFLKVSYEHISRGITKIFRNKG